MVGLQAPETPLDRLHHALAMILGRVRVRARRRIAVLGRQRYAVVVALGRASMSRARPIQRRNLSCSLRKLNTCSGLALI